jgi:hypothetical protein
LEKKFNYMVFYNRRPADRRKVENRRFFLNQEYLDHPPERRVNSRRQNTGDRRKSPVIVSHLSTERTGNAHA